MDYLKVINELNVKKGELIAQAEGLIAENKFGDELTGVQNQIKGLNTQISQVMDLAAASEAGAKVPEDGKDGKDGKDDKPLHVFDSLGEQLQSVANFAKTHVRDERLDRVNNAVQGGAESVGSDGGFAVQENFAGMILRSAAETGDILNRVDSYTVGANSNSARWLRIDETDISSTVYGGVQMFWSSEGMGANASRPKFKEQRMELEKLMGFAYVTDEMLQDVSFMSSFLGTCFTLAAQRILEDAIINGDGLAKPLGILNSGALISVAKETGQSADTVVTANIRNMWQRFFNPRRGQAVWLAHPDVEAELQQLNAPDNSLIWMPEGGLTEAPYQRIFGRPVIYNDNLAALGDKGDILLADLKEYQLLKKGGAKQAWSMHVEFLTDQQCFRIIFRVNGAPKVDNTLTIKNSTKTRSPFVTLAARA